MCIRDSCGGGAGDGSGERRARRRSHGQLDAREPIVSGAVRAYTAHRLLRVYPSGWARVNSENALPSAFWRLGVQLVALNMQTEGPELNLNRAMFRRNGGSGYVLRADAGAVGTACSAAPAPPVVERRNRRETLSRRLSCAGAAAASAVRGLGGMAAPSTDAPACVIRVTLLHAAPCRAAALALATGGATGSAWRIFPAATARALHGVLPGKARAPAAPEHHARAKDTAAVPALPTGATERAEAGGEADGALDTHDGALDTHDGALDTHGAGRRAMLRVLSAQMVRSLDAAYVCVTLRSSERLADEQQFVSRAVHRAGLSASGDGAIHAAGAPADSLGRGFCFEWDEAFKLELQRPCSAFLELSLYTSQLQPHCADGAAPRAGSAVAAVASGEDELVATATIWLPALKPGWRSLPLRAVSGSAWARGGVSSFDLCLKLDDLSHGAKALSTLTRRATVRRRWRDAMRSVHIERARREACALDDETARAAARPSPSGAAPHAPGARADGVAASAAGPPRPCSPLDDRRSRRSWLQASSLSVPHALALSDATPPRARKPSVLRSSVGALSALLVGARAQRRPSRESTPTRARLAQSGSSGDARTPSSSDAHAAVQPGDDERSTTDASRAAAPNALMPSRALAARRGRSSKRFMRSAPSAPDAAEHSLLHSDIQLVGGAELDDAAPEHQPQTM